METSLSGITAKAMSINVWPPPGRNTRDHPARPRTDAVRWRCQCSRQFPRGNWRVKDCGQTDVHERREAGANVVSVLFDLQQMLFDGAADVALGFYVETGGLRAATKPMSIRVGPPCTVALSTPLGPPRFPPTCHDPPSPRRRTLREDAANEPIPADTKAGVVRRDLGSRVRRFPRRNRCVMHCRHSTTPPHRCPSTSGRRARRRLQERPFRLSRPTLPRFAFAEGTATVGMNPPASQLPRAGLLAACSGIRLDGQGVSTWKTHTGIDRDPRRRWTLR